MKSNSTTSGDLGIAQVVDLRQGISADEVHGAILAAARGSGVAMRALTFHMADMADRELFRAKAYPDMVAYARGELDFDRTKTYELIRVGRELQELTKIDEAFCQGRLSWSRVRELVRVATPETEAEWLTVALETRSFERLQRELAGSEKGKRPRKGKGLPNVKMTWKARLPVVEHEMVVEASAKLAAMLDTKLTPARALIEMAKLVLSMNADGTVPGFQPVNSKLFTIVLHRNEGNEGDAPVTTLHTDEGQVELAPAQAELLEEEAAVVDLRAEPTAECSCSGDQCVREDCDLRMPGSEIDCETPVGMRKAVFLRDGKRCLCCTSHDNLMAHHGIFRSRGGRTVMDNMLTVCSGCHALIHTGLLIVEGRPSTGLRFVDAEGREVGRFTEGVLPTVNVERTPRTVDAPRDINIDSLPLRADADWWKQVAHLLSWNERRGTLELQAGELAPRREPAPHWESPAGELRLSDLVGQVRVREVLATSVRGAAGRAAQLDHVLLCGAPGLGKTTLAQALATEMGAPLLAASATLLRDPIALISLLTGLRGGEVVFIDEIHALRDKVAETLYEAMENGRVSLLVQSPGTGVEARTLQLELPPFTLVGATTDPDRLLRPFLSRFGLRLNLEPYADAELATLIEQQAWRQDLPAAHDAAAFLAAAGRGTPREALSLQARARDLAAASGLPTITIDVARNALHQLGIDERGLDAIDRQILEVLRTSERPLGLQTLAARVRISVCALLERHEPWLLYLGLIDITPRGRVALDVLDP